ncbi:MAG: dicarboxylate/amino acid:cation symporter [Fimbriimonadaceae bacterium]|nr:dicarboxylate/amino acid:cation symporter [Fimbriimonadaceae bacterium]
MELGAVEPGGKKGMALHTKILIGLILGAIAGFVARESLGKDSETLSKMVDWTKPVGEIFLNMIFMVVVPLLFAALVLGVSELGDIRKVGRIGIRSLLMTVVLSAIAVLIGVGAINLVDPSKSISADQKAELFKNYSKEQRVTEDPVQAKDAAALGMVPKNPLRDAVAAFSGGILPFMIFALIFGIALASIEAEKALPVQSFLEGLFAVSLKIIEFAMKLAPIGVFCLIFGSAAKLGYELFASLGTYVLVVLVALAIHQFVTYSLVIKYVARRSPAEFFRQMRTVMATAFATSSSNATLPTALRAAEEDLGLPRKISNFVLTVGATANQNGTALFEGITIVFLARMFGVDLTVGQQFMVMGLAIVGGIGTAGVPSGSIPMIAGVLATLGVPSSAVGLVLGIDRIMDMSRTVLNVTGDMTIAACVTAMEERSEAKSMMSPA